jgi:hypothetical protein
MYTIPSINTTMNIPMIRKNLIFDLITQERISSLHGEATDPIVNQ